MPSGADTGDHHVDWFIGEIGQDFLRGRANVHLVIGRIVELRGHPRAVGFFDQFGRAFDRAFHALGLVGQIERGTIGEHQTPPFHAHAFRHHQDQLVTLHRGDHCQTDTGVAAGRFDDRSAGLQIAARLRSFDHGQRDTILDRTTGVGAFRFHPYFVIREQTRQADMRCCTNGCEDGIGFHLVSPFCGLSAALSSNSSGGSKVLVVRNTGNTRLHKATVMIAPAPPDTTARTGPIR